MIKVETPDSRQLEEISTWQTWEKEVCEFDWSYTQKEQFYILEGSAIISVKPSEQVAIKPGDFVTIENGVESRWKITSAIKKHFKFFP
ncbi:hypothetical protein AX279_16515 [Pseudomonas sp. J237]|nr:MULTISPECIES: cupin domain-containing protein [Pseudomonas]OEO24775.1 hypothetical protein AX279_16515 [Pseudomonas sp. J237]